MIKESDGNFIVVKHNKYIRFKQNFKNNYLYEPIKNKGVYSEVLEVREYKMPKLEAEYLSVDCTLFLQEKFDSLLVTIDDEEVFLYDVDCYESLLKLIDGFFKRKKMVRDLTVLNDIDFYKLKIMNCCRTESNHTIHKATYEKIRKVYDFCMENIVDEKKEIEIESKKLASILGVKKEGGRLFSSMKKHLGECGLTLTWRK